MFIDVISCKDGVLSVKITTLEVQASGYETIKGINIDLVNNKVIELKEISLRITQIMWE